MKTVFLLSPVTVYGSRLFPSLFHPVEVDRISEDLLRRPPPELVEVVDPLLFGQFRVADLAGDGRAVEDARAERDVARLFGRDAGRRKDRRLLDAVEFEHLPVQKRRPDPAFAALVQV